MLAVAAAAALLAAPLTGSSQALPDEIREAGVTVIQWQSVLAEVQRSAAEKHVSERALAIVCTKLGVQLAKGHHFDLDQMIALISSRADEIDALNRAYSMETSQGGDPALSALLQQARTAIDAGDLDRAHQLFLQARAANQLHGAEIAASDAQVLALQADYLGAAAELGQAAGELPANATHQKWQYVVQQANMLQTRGALFDEPQPLRDAVALYRDTALPLVPRPSDPEDWAETQNNLGVALGHLGDEGDDQALKDSVAAYAAALEVHTRAQHPAEWARDETNLGTALERLGEKGDEAALSEAIAAYKGVLVVQTRQQSPSDWAATQNNLGNALTLLGAERGDAPTLENAVAAYQSALQVDTRERDPMSWARDESNLGTAFERLGELGDYHAQNDAVVAFRAALAVHTRDRDPADWARDEGNLGNALEVLGEQDDDPDLKGAVLAYRAALEVDVREGDPAAWANDQDNLGIALTALGGQGASPELADALAGIGEPDTSHALKDAVAAIQGALEVDTRSRSPASWARDENNLGNALRAEGVNGDRQALEGAAAAYRLALQVWTPQQYPAQARMCADNLWLVELELKAPSK